MARLSSPIFDIKAHYQIVVVGSGYGGSIAASRLARAGQQVCLLERGKELWPGDYPDTEVEAAAATQMNLPLGRVGDPTGLYEWHVNDDISVLVGCGLGGTSLINANVALRPDARLFDDPVWPQAFRGDVATRLEEGFRQAEAMLKPSPYPEHYPPLPKLEALEKSAAAMNAPFYRLPLNITFEAGANHVGVDQQACNLCGDCAAGCNQGAKNTTLMNYLPDARAHGAEIFTGVSVRTIERRDGRWLVHYRLIDSGADVFDAPAATLSANIVILAAGALGSTEILLRSKTAGLALSDELGRHFYGNGDLPGIAYNTEMAINAVGAGRLAERLGPVGPTITGVIDLRGAGDLEEGMVVEEGAVNSWLAAALPKALALAARAGRRLGGAPASTVAPGSPAPARRSLASVAALVARNSRELESLVQGPYAGAVKNSQFFLVMAHDSASGRLRLENDRLRISWPGLRDEPFVQRINERLEEAAEALGGEYVDNALWPDLPTSAMATTHPLGGCAMAEDASQGVVNHKGQLFAGREGSAVYESLYVSDGAVIPRSIGANPLLTISAIAERNVALLAAERGWTIDYGLARGGASSFSPAPGRLGIQFTETMGGFFSTKVKGDFDQAARQGQDDGSTFRFVVTILADDLDRMMSEPEYTSRLTGTVVAPALSLEPLTVGEGRFNLLASQPGDPAGRRRMSYRMTLNARDGRRFYMEGFKLIRDDRGFDIWRDTTTLYITVFGGDSPAGPVVGQGVLRIYPEDFRRQIRRCRSSTPATAASGWRRRPASAAFLPGRFLTSTAASSPGRHCSSRTRRRERSGRCGWRRRKCIGRRPTTRSSCG
jgi:cholesterol oxidase